MSTNDVLKIVLAIGAILAILVHAVFPRYEWRTVGENGAVIVVYDRWSNYFQRAVYDDRGKVTAMEPFRPLF